MAQAGKEFPRSTFQDFHAVEGNRRLQYPPRKIKITDFNGTGTLAAKWIGLTVLSEVSERFNRGVRYRVIHPSDPTAILVCDCHLMQPYPTSPQTYEFVPRCDYYDGGTFMGHFGRPPLAAVNWDFWRLPPQVLWNFSQTDWSSLTNPTLFAGFYGPSPFPRGQVASWAEQPEFQPYRTRP